MRAAVQNDRVTRVQRLAAIAVAVVLTAASVASCGGDDSDDPDAGSSQPSGSEATTEESGGSAEPEPYLPVPDGVSLTAPGSELRVDEAAVVAWEPRQQLVGVLDLTVTRLERTSFAESFQGWQLDAATRRHSPFFVRATLTNTGETDLGGRAVPLYALAANNTLVEASSFKTNFEPCPGNGVFPEKFGPGATKDVCLVYLVPHRGELTAVSFRPDQDFDPITWTGPIQKVEQEKPKKADRKQKRA